MLLETKSAFLEAEQILAHWIKIIVSEVWLTPKRKTQIFSNKGGGPLNFRTSIFLPSLNEEWYLWEILLDTKLSYYEAELVCVRDMKGAKVFAAKLEHEKRQRHKKVKNTKIITIKRIYFFEAFASSVINLMPSFPLMNGATAPWNGQCHLFFFFQHHPLSFFKSFFRELTLFVLP